jgi:hypothetical protein
VFLKLHLTLPSRVIRPNDTPTRSGCSGFCGYDKEVWFDRVVSRAAQYFFVGPGSAPFQKVGSIEGDGVH